MSAVITSPEDIVNIALRRIGYKIRVGSLMDGSMAASVALDLFGQTRDEMLRSGDYRFAQWTAPAVVQKTAPPNYFDTPWTTAFPQLPWKFQVEYPSDCLKVRAIKPLPGFLFDPLPVENLFTEANDDTSTPPRKCILLNVENALIVYTRQVLEPATWDVDFVEALAATLSKKFIPQLANLQTANLAVRDEAVAVATAANTQG